MASTICSVRSNSKWNNEEWIVRNVPSDAKSLARIYNKDDNKIVDNYIGEFEIVNLTNNGSRQNVYPIIGSFGRHVGRFHLSIQSTKSSNDSIQLPRYTFDGLCRYYRYDLLDGLNSRSNDSIDSIWKIQLRRISLFFPSDDHQEVNQKYKSTQKGVKLERTLKSNENGRLTSTDDLWKLSFLDREIQKMKPRAFNYIIDDDTWRFSEITHQFFTDFEIKHGRLANSSESVRYAGEFHLRPKFGWNKIDDQWKIVFDNASGTYSPNASLLINLKQLLLFNFPSLNIVIYDYKHPMLKDSLEQFQMAANIYKRMNKTTIKFN